MSQPRWPMVYAKNQAIAEGWVIIHSPGGAEIQSLNNPFATEPQVPTPIFASDALAIMHVINRAEQGSRWHQDALAICGYSPWKKVKAA